MSVKQKGGAKQVSNLERRLGDWNAMHSNRDNYAIDSHTVKTKDGRTFHRPGSHTRS